MSKRFNRRDEEVEVAPPPQPKIKVTGRGLRPDGKYHDLVAAKFINTMMWDGKKSVSQRIFYDAMEILAKRNVGAPLEVFHGAINNVKPVIEVKSRRVGGATWQVPVEVNAKRGQALAFRWILEASRGKRGRPMAERLANELMDAFKKEGAAITKRENTHKMAEANKAFSHFSW